MSSHIQIEPMKGNLQFGANVKNVDVENLTGEHD